VAAGAILPRGDVWAWRLNPATIASRIALPFVLAVLCAGCAMPRAVSPVAPQAKACVEMFERADRLVERAGVRDEGEARVRGFPYLRIDRLHASFAGEVSAPERFSAWIGALGALDSRALDFERRNLSVEQRAALASGAEMEECRALLVEHDRRDAARRALLVERAVVADDYLAGWRAAGLYPLAAPFVSHAIARWHREARAVFATPLEQLPVHGELRRWSSRSGAVLEAAQVRRLVDGSRDALGIPRPDPEVAGVLFGAFAPSWEIDVVDDNDRIGAPYRHPRLGVDVQRPVEYHLLSHVRRGERVLLQLDYVIWLPARPGRDMYAGRLDGLTWRVTLAPDGTALIQDSIHNCGCYHQYFPGPGLVLRKDLPRHYFEMPLVPSAAPPGPLVIRLSHGEHFIERVYADDAARAAQPLAVLDYSRLRALPAEQGGGSLFGRHGIVPGSQRGERFALWPMGIRSPGAMRQWGRHPVAFVGRRHFDDPWLLDSLFTGVGADAAH
jgi:hypothetical protein